jgi:hypothetical protein
MLSNNDHAKYPFTFTPSLLCIKVNISQRLCIMYKTYKSITRRLETLLNNDYLPDCSFKIIKMTVIVINSVSI